jgi:hypothetical protein
VTSDTELGVTPQGEGTFRVDVRSARTTTTHMVEVPPGMADELGWGKAAEADLVRESFVFLLEREPPTSILRNFNLDVIARYFPEYPTAIRPPMK